MLPLGPPDRYGSPYKAKSAFAAWPGLLAEPAAPVSKAEELDFREREASWIEDWARFAGRGAVADQVRFEREWSALRAYANERGVRLIGDVPIYVAPGSADHRARPELFVDDAVAGTPPDAYTDKGQLWGNPLYDWPAARREGYAWWIARLARTFALFDLARIDHFRGFVAYWAVPKGARHALSGRWRRGPGRAVFDAAGDALGALPLIAEDLGRDHAAGAAAARRARAARHGRAPVRLGARRAGQRARRRQPRRAPDRLHRHARQRHAARLVRVAAGRDRGPVSTPTGRGVAEEPWWDLIALTFSSRARVAMVQAQDVLGLGSEARMNQPGSAAGRVEVADGCLAGCFGGGAAAGGDARPRGGRRRSTANGALRESAGCRGAPATCAVAHRRARQWTLLCAMSAAG